MSKVFAARLRQLRKEHKKTQRELGEILRYGSTAIANYEMGRNEPSFADLVKIADYFQVSTDFLLGRTEKRVIAEIRIILEEEKVEKKI